MTDKDDDNTVEIPFEANPKMFDGKDLLAWISMRDDEPWQTEDEIQEYGDKHGK